MSLTDGEVALVYKSIFPSRTFDYAPEELLDVVDALAEEANADGFAVVEQLATEVNPSTATPTGSLPDWEAAAGLDKTAVAISGSTAARQAQLVARLRERGYPDKEYGSRPSRVQASLAAICGYVPEIVRHSRATLRTVNTRSFGTPLTVPALSSATVSVNIGDNAVASKAGAQFLVNMDANGVNGSLIQIEFAPPNYVPFDIGQGTTRPLVADNADWVYPWTAFAGQDIDGVWSVTVTNNDPVNDVLFNTLAVLVEGIGRDTTTGAEGYGARIFEASVAINEALCGPGYDRGAAIVEVARWNPAWALLGVALYQTDGGLTALGDDDNCIGDLCIGA